MDALPRASFLTYFRTPNQPQPKQRIEEEHQKGHAPHRGHCSQAPLLPRIPEDATAEDTAERSIFDDYDHLDDYEEGEDDEQGWSWGDILSFTGYMLLVMLIVLNMDFLLSAYNGNAGLLRWDGYRESAGSSSREMRFCLAEQDRVAPSSRIWRYHPRGSDSGCATRVLTIHAPRSEEHKLFTEDIILGEVTASAVCDSLTREVRSESHGRGRYFEMDDDLAEEGILSHQV